MQLEKKSQKNDAGTVCNEKPIKPKWLVETTGQKTDTKEVLHVEQCKVVLVCGGDWRKVWWQVVHIFQQNTGDSIKRRLTRNKKVGARKPGLNARPMHCNSMQPIK